MSIFCEYGSMSANLDQKPVALRSAVGGLCEVPVEGLQKALGALDAQCDADEHALCSQPCKLLAESGAWVQAGRRSPVHTGEGARQQVHKL